MVSPGRLQRDLLRAHCSTWAKQGWSAHLWKELRLRCCADYFPGVSFSRVGTGPVGSSFLCSCGCSLVVWSPVLLPRHTPLSAGNVSSLSEPMSINQMSAEQSKHDKYLSFFL